MDLANSLRRLGWRARLALLALAGVLPFTAFIAYQIAEIRHRRAEEALQRVFEYAQLGAYNYEDDLGEAKSLVEFLAQVQDVKSGLADSCQRFLSSAALSRRWSNGIWVVGENGRVQCATVANGVGLDLSERPEYRRAAASSGFHVSNFFIGKLRNQPQALASLVTRTEAGERILIGVTLDLPWFDRLAAMVGERAGATVMLLDGKGAVLASYPGDKSLTGQSVAHHLATQTILAASHGSFDGRSFNGTRVFWGFKKLAGTNLRLAVSFERDVLFANLNRGTAQAIGLFVLVSFLMSGLIWLAGNRYFANPMRELDELLKATLENMDQGLIVVDKDGTLPICNKRAIELLGLPEHLMLSQPDAETVIAYQAAQGEFDNLSDDVKERLLPRIHGESRNVYEREGPNGTVLEVRTVPFARGAGVVRTYTDITARKHFERLLESLAKTDGLTGLVNRRHFDATLEMEFSRACRSKGKLALIMIDVDCFKAFNDRYGHHAGDVCLQDVAKAVHANIRRPGDVAGRYGGEEFIVALPDTDLAGAVVVAEKIRQAVADLGIGHKGSPRGIVSISLGVAEVEHDDGRAALVKKADAALYQAKNDGRDRVQVFALLNEDTPAAA